MHGVYSPPAVAMGLVASIAWFASTGSCQEYRQLVAAKVKGKIACIASDDRLPFVVCSVYQEAFAPKDSDLVCFRADNLEIASKCPSVGHWIGNIFLSDSCRRIVTIGADDHSVAGTFPDFNTVGNYVLDPATGILTRESTRDASAFFVHVTPTEGDAFRAIGSYADSTKVDVLDISTCTVFRQFDPGLDHVLGAVELTSSGKIFVGANDWVRDFYRFTLWNWDGTKVTEVDRGKGPRASTLAWSEKQKLLAVGDSIGRIELFDLADGKFHSRGENHLPFMPKLMQLQFSPDETKLAISTFQELAICDVKTTTVIQRIQGEWLRYSLGDRQLALSMAKGDSTELSVWSLK